MRAWAGTTGDTLVQLEIFERSLDVKRRVAADDLEAMSRIKFLEGPVFITAMMKAMMSAPPKYAETSGDANLFSSADFTSVGPSGKLRHAALRAAKLMATAREYVKAYANSSETTTTKIISQLDVRLVMHMLCRCRAFRRMALIFSPAGEGDVDGEQRSPMGGCGRRAGWSADGGR